MSLVLDRTKIPDSNTAKPIIMALINAAKQTRIKEYSSTPKKDDLQDQLLDFFKKFETKSFDEKKQSHKYENHFYEHYNSFNDLLLEKKQNISSKINPNNSLNISEFCSKMAENFEKERLVFVNKYKVQTIKTKHQNLPALFTDREQVRVYAANAEKKSRSEIIASDWFSSSEQSKEQISDENRQRFLAKNDSKFKLGQEVDILYKTSGLSYDPTMQKSAKRRQDIEEIARMRYLLPLIGIGKAEAAKIIDKVAPRFVPMISTKTSLASDDSLFDKLAEIGRMLTRNNGHSK